jgi:hypothetical protein
MYVIRRTLLLKKKVMKVGSDMENTEDWKSEFAVWAETLIEGLATADFTTKPPMWKVIR